MDMEHIQNQLNTLSATVSTNDSIVQETLKQLLARTEALELHMGEVQVLLASYERRIRGLTVNYIVLGLTAANLVLLILCTSLVYLHLQGLR